MRLLLTVILALVVLNGDAMWIAIALAALYDLSENIFTTREER